MGSGSASCCPQTDPDASESVTNLVPADFHSFCLPNILQSTTTQTSEKNEFTDF